MSKECFIATFGSGTNWHWEVYSPSPEGSQAVQDASCCAQAFEDGRMCDGFPSSASSEADGQKWLAKRLHLQARAS